MANGKRKALGEKPKATKDMPTTPRPKRKASERITAEGASPKELPPEEKNVRRVVFIKAVIFDAVKKRAAAEGKPPSEIIREALVAYLDL